MEKGVQQIANRAGDVGDAAEIITIVAKAEKATGPGLDLIEKIGGTDGKASDAIYVVTLVAHPTTGNAYEVVNDLVDGTLLKLGLPDVGLFVLKQAATWYMEMLPPMAPAYPSQINTCVDAVCF